MAALAALLGGSTSDILAALTPSKPDPHAPPPPRKTPSPDHPSPPPAAQPSFTFLPDPIVAAAVKSEDSSAVHPENSSSVAKPDSSSVLKPEASVVAKPENSVLTALSRAGAVTSQSGGKLTSMSGVKLGASGLGLRPGLAVGSKVTNFAGVKVSPLGSVAAPGGLARGASMVVMPEQVQDALPSPFRTKSTEPGDLMDVAKYIAGGEECGNTDCGGLRVRPCSGFGKARRMWGGCQEYDPPASAFHYPCKSIQQSTMRCMVQTVRE